METSPKTRLSSSIEREFGVDHNVKILPDTVVESYLGGLSARLAQLGEILAREGEVHVNPYVHKIQQTLACMDIKFQLRDEERVNFQFKIDPTDSGFPKASDFYILERDKATVEERLVSADSRDAIVEGIRDAVLRGKDPAKAQFQLRRLNFYQSLAGTDLLKEYEVGVPELVNEEGGERRYILEWGCIDRRANLPVFYKMWFSQDDYPKPLHKFGNKALALLLNQARYGDMSLHGLAFQIDRRIPDLHPEAVERYTIGPFYNQNTDNTPEMDKLLASAGGETILKFKVERVFSTKSVVRRPSGIIASIFGGPVRHEIFGPVYEERRMIAPFGLKQVFGSRDENGKPCRVYAVTKDGAIVG